MEKKLTKYYCLLIKNKLNKMSLGFFNDFMKMIQKKISIMGATINTQLKIMKIKCICIRNFENESKSIIHDLI